MCKQEREQRKPLTTVFLINYRVEEKPLNVVKHDGDKRVESWAKLVKTFPSESKVTCLNLRPVNKLGSPHFVSKLHQGRT